MNNFKSQPHTLETVKYYCYLGMTIRYNGNIIAPSSLLIEKGRKAYFKIKKCIGFDNPCILLEKLFCALVSFLFFTVVNFGELTCPSKILIHMNL